MSAPGCRATGCFERVPLERLFCERHDRLLQSDTRRVLAQTYCPGVKPSRRFLRALEFAQREILDAQMTGHPAPAPQLFEW